MHYFRLIRPHHWVKNLLVFVPLFFVVDFFDLEKLTSALYAFIVFSLVASSIYIINDIVDRHEDALHPRKKHRPIASQQLHISEAIGILVLFIVIASLLVYFLIPQMALVIGVYFLLAVLYSLWLKHVAIVDILLVASFYLFRIVGGGVVTDVFISRWLILCTIFVALFLVLGKRKAEFKQEKRRKVLSLYNLDFLDYSLLIMMGLAIMSYSLYSVLVIESPLGVYSIFFVLLGMFRYLLISHDPKKLEAPEDILFSDSVILVSVIGWLGFLYLIMYAV